MVHRNSSLMMSYMKSERTRGSNQRIPDKIICGCSPNNVDENIDISERAKKQIIDVVVNILRCEIEWMRPIIIIEIINISLIILRMGGGDKTLGIKPDSKLITSERFTKGAISIQAIKVVCIRVIGLITMFVKENFIMKLDKSSWFSWFKQSKSYP